MPWTSCRMLGEVRFENLGRVYLILCRLGWALGFGRSGLVSGYKQAASNVEISGEYSRVMMSTECE